MFISNIRASVKEKFGKKSKSQSIMKMIAELRFCAGSNPAHNVPEIRDYEVL